MRNNIYPIKVPRKYLIFILNTKSLAGGSNLARVQFAAARLNSLINVDISCVLDTVEPLNMKPPSIRKMHVHRHTRRYQRVVSRPNEGLKYLLRFVDSSKVSV